MITTNLKTGDLIICSGTGFLSERIKQMQRITARIQKRETEVNTELSHVAGIVWQRWVAEATTRNDWCNKEGYQLNHIDLWLNHYPGNVWVRRLQHADEEKLNLIARPLSFYAMHLCGTPYENGIAGVMELFFAGIEWSPFVATFARPQKLATANLHCTEGWAKCLNMCRILKNGNVSNQLPPMEWDVNGKVDGLMQNGYAYGEPEELKRI